MFYNPDEGNIMLVDKPYGLTSFDVVGFLRKQLRISTGLKKIKIGHAGTLDPLATGLLIVCVGKMTKQAQIFQDLDKEYTGIITLGATTPSFDLETEIDKTYPYEHITLEQINDAAKSFIGTIKQTPPIYSAVKVDGVRAYKFARNKEDVDIKYREVNISVFDIIEVNLPDVHFRISCSKGTYIRSIANDFGTKLVSGGYVKSLRRTKIGNYDVKDAKTIEEYAKLINPDWSGSIRFKSKFISKKNN